MTVVEFTLVFCHKRKFALKYQPSIKCFQFRILYKMSVSTIFRFINIYFSDVSDPSILSHEFTAFPSNLSFFTSLFFFHLSFPSFVFLCLLLHYKLISCLFSFAFFSIHTHYIFSSFLPFLQYLVLYFSFIGSQKFISRHLNIRFFHTCFSKKSLS